MSHTRVKTTYSAEGPYASTETKELYCHHNNIVDSVVFYSAAEEESEDVMVMVFDEWESGNDLWDAMQRLWFPYKEKWGGELKDNVEHYLKKDKNKI